MSCSSGGWHTLSPVGLSAPRRRRSSWCTLWNIYIPRWFFFVLREQLFLVNLCLGIIIFYFSTVFQCIYKTQMHTRKYIYMLVCCLASYVLHAYLNIFYFSYWIFQQSLNSESGLKGRDLLVFRELERLRDAEGAPFLAWQLGKVHLFVEKKAGFVVWVRLLCFTISGLATGQSTLICWKKSGVCCMGSFALFHRFWPW